MGIRLLRREASPIERVLALIVILVLFTLAVHKMLAVFAAAEQAYMTATLNNIRSALKAEALVRMARRDLEGLAALAGSNPMETVMDSPENYLGELESPDPRRVEEGSWYFDRRGRVLVYRVENAGRFETPLAGPARARFRVRLAYTDADGDGVFDPRVDAFEGITLEPLEPYRWAGPRAGD